MLPPLRERKEDIPLLIAFFDRETLQQFFKKYKIFKWQRLMRSFKPFSGYIRELENIVERCATLASGDIIDTRDLPLLDKAYQSSPNAAFSSSYCGRCSKNTTFQRAEMTLGNKTKAAQMLGISRKTLWEKMNTYGLE